MGKIILMIAFAIIFILAAYNIITKSNQNKVKSIIRIGAFALFVFLTLAWVIQWSFRWYGLGVLLLIWAMLGVWTLISKKSNVNEYKAGHTVFNAIVSMLLVGMVVTPALIFPQSTLPKPTGKHEVATFTATYTDNNRIETFSKTGGNRKVNVEFWFPKDSGNKYPLVVFSPGSFGTKGSNTSTFLELASNGYVVCSIDHPYHALVTSGADGQMVTMDSSFIQEVTGANNGKYDESTTFKLEQKWMQLRTADINFVLESVLAHAKEADSETVYQRIDPDKIGLMGHSLGGESSAQVARERSDIGAVINLDADLHGEYLEYVDGKYTLNEKVYPVPILTIFSDVMARLIAAVPNADTVVAVKHVTATAPKAFEVHLMGTDHMSLTDLPLISPFLVSIINASVPKGGGQEVDAYATIEKMNAIVLQFFDVYLKGEGNFTYNGTY